MDFESPKHSVRLSTLNPAIKERVQKFDIKNDGELDIEEAMQGLITLQKQSNNYKKMIWFLIPIICLVLAGTFGTTILAINLTKEIKQNNGLLTSSKSLTPIRTMLADPRDTMYSSMFSNDFNLINKIHIGQHSIEVKGIYQTRLNDENKSVYVNSDMIHFVWNQTGEYAVFYNPGFENHIIAHVVFEEITRALSSHQIFIQTWLKVFAKPYTIQDVASMNEYFKVSTSKVPSSSYSYEPNDGVILSKSSRAHTANGGCNSDLCKDASCVQVKCSGVKYCQVGATVSSTHFSDSNGPCKLKQY
jgi:hypothetical protein